MDINKEVLSIQLNELNIDVQTLIDATDLFQLVVDSEKINMEQVMNAFIILNKLLEDARDKIEIAISSLEG